MYRLSPFHRDTLHIPAQPLLNDAVEMGRQRPELGGPPCPQHILSWLSVRFPLPTVRGMCGNSVAGSLPKSPPLLPAPLQSTHFRPYLAARSLVPVTPGSGLQTTHLSHTGYWSALLACRPHALCVGPSRAFWKVQLLILLAGVLSSLTSPVKMKESFRNQSSDSSRERKSLMWPPFSGFLGWGVVGSGCLLCPSTSSIRLFIHLSNPYIIIGIPQHPEVNVARSPWGPNK